MRALSYLSAVALLFALAACDTFQDDTASDAVSYRATAAEEEIGNNLSYPVIWGDLVALTLRGSPDHISLGGAFFLQDGERWYVQQDSLNEWQAESAFPTLTAQGRRGFPVSAVDWGDNLEARDWRYGQQIRVEVVLTKDLDRPMVAYAMRSEDSSIHGPDEVWGTNGERYESREATVYAATAQLVIQKLTKSRDDPSLAAVWTGDEWTGDLNAPVFSQGVWETVEGPYSFKTEVNAKGQVLYGLNWRAALGGQGPGDYRITFVLQKDSPNRRNTIFNAQTVIVPPDEHLARPEARPGAGGVAQLVWQHHLTYIDVRLTGG